MTRAIHKAKLPFWYTEGFNPHVFLTITLPISLGYSGTRESMDVKLEDDNMPFEEIIEKLNAGLPRDINVYAISEQVMKVSTVTYASYDITVKTEDSKKLYDEFMELFGDEKIMVEKKSKKAIRNIDIKPDFQNAVFNCDDDKILKITVTLLSSNAGSINPRLLFEGYKLKFGEEFFFGVTRTNCFDEKMNEFI